MRHARGAIAAASGADGFSGDAATIELRNVVKRYVRTKQSDLLVLPETSLRWEPGEFVCLIGPSGCGKSTLLSMVAGFEQPSAGEILVDGQPVRGPSPQRGVVFQDPNALFPWLTVQRNVSFGLECTRVPRAIARGRVQQVLDMVNLSEFAKAYPLELSGGMRQRVAIARALVMQPRVLLMDEPFGALDAITRQHLQTELAVIWSETHTSVLFVTHSIEEAVALGDRVVVLGGRGEGVKALVEVPLSRPRARNVSAFHNIRNEIDQFIE